MLAVLSGVLLSGCETAPGGAAIDPGSGYFLHPDVAAQRNIRMRVFYHRPDGYSRDRPILFVMHGLGRNAENNCSVWRKHAAAGNALVICPEFSKALFPSLRQYSQGDVINDDTGGANLREDWTFGVVERIFATVRRLTGSTRKKFLIYGHSAGAQFVHRYLTFEGGHSIERAVAANAGWYTLPSDGWAYPYGLRGAPVGEADLGRLFARDLVILLGEKDTERGGKLRKSQAADDQGEHRLARGRNYFHRGRAQAARLRTPFRWRLITVPGAGHSNGQMAPAAARLLFE